MNFKEDGTDDSVTVDCGHPECREISRRLEVISREQGYAAWEQALYVLGYCAPRHEDETEYGDMPPDAEKWIDPHTMPFTAQRLRWQRHEAQEARSRALTEEQLEEFRREMEDDRRTDLAFIKLWEELTEQSKQRPLSNEEKCDIRCFELHLGGRDKLVACQSRLAAKS